MLDEEALQFCETLFNATANGVSRMGGSSRDSVRVSFPNRSVIATKRKNPGRANLEAIVLRELNEGEAAVPAILHFDKEWLVQEDLGDLRLTMVLAKSDETNGPALLEKCIKALSQIHQIGNDRGLTNRLPKIGHEKEWIQQLILIPERVGKYLGQEAPKLDVGKLIPKLQIQTPSFIKWDTRPGNIMVSRNGDPAWIDWEHCGVRNALDDFAWLLADEYVPDWPEAESRYFDLIASLSNNTESDLNAEAYTKLFGTFHSCHRLSLILNKKSDGAWWDATECVANDRVGVFPIAVKRLCQRASRWAQKDNFTEPLALWFDQISDKIFSEK